MRAALVCTTAAVAALGLAACTPKEEPPGPTVDASEVLGRRPDLDQAVAQYEEMLEDLAGRLEKQGLATGWRNAVERVDADCVESGLRPEGGSAILHWYHSPDTIQDWKKAKALVAGFAKKKGFNHEDAAGPEVIYMTDGPYGAALSLQDYPDGSILGVETGCHQKHEEP